MFKARREEGRRNKGAKLNTTALISIGVIIAVILIGLILYISSMKSIGGDVAKLASYFPENTSFYASVDLSKDKLKKLEELSGDALTLENIVTTIQENSENPEQAKEAIEVIKEFEKSIEPKFSFGTWSEDNNQSDTQDFVLTTIVKDKAAIPELIKKVTDNEIEFTKTKIDDTEVYAGSEDKGGAYVVIDDVLVLANDLDTLKIALETNKQKKSLISSNKVVDVLLNLPEDRFLTILFNTEDISKAAQKKTPSDISKTMQISEIVKTMSYTGIGVDIQDEVIIARSYTPYNLDSVQDAELKNELNTLLSSKTNLEAPKILPADTFAFVSIGGMSHLIKTYLASMEPDQKVAIMQYTEKLKQLTNLDFNNDFLPIFSKEMTVAGIGSGKDVDPIIALTNQPNTLQVLNKLSGIVTSADPTATVVEKKQANNELKVIGGSQLPVKFAYGKVGGLVLMGKADPVEIIASNTANFLADSKIYSNLSSQLVNSPNLVVYINTDKLQEVLMAVNKDPEKIAKIKDLNKNVSGLMISFTNMKQKALVGNLFLDFKKGSNKRIPKIKTEEKEG